MTNEQNDLLLKCQRLEFENESLKGLLRKAQRAVEIAVSSELDHGDIASANRFRDLKTAVVETLQIFDKNQQF